MDKRDPVVMQAIANVIGAQTKDMGCLGPSPGNAQAIYDEIRRLDRARLDEAEDRRKAEVEAQQKAAEEGPSSLTAAGPTNGRSIGPSANSHRRDYRRAVGEQRGEIEAGGAQAAREGIETPNSIVIGCKLPCQREAWRPLRRLSLYPQ